MSRVSNLANKITLLRFILAIICFVLLIRISYYLDNQLNIPGEFSFRYLIIITIAIYIIAILTDVLDGYVARKFSEVSRFGRVWDPLIDKILIMGSLIILASTKKLQFILPAWLVVVVVGREFLIQGIRGFVEAQGIKFGSDIFGKQKMALQSITVIFILCYIGFFDKSIFVKACVQALVWLMLISTVLSGVIYTIKSWKYLFEN